MLACTLTHATIIAAAALLIGGLAAITGVFLRL